MDRRRDAALDAISCSLDRRLSGEAGVCSGLAAREEERPEKGLARLGEGPAKAQLESWPLSISLLPRPPPRCLLVYSLSCCSHYLLRCLTCCSISCHQLLHLAPLTHPTSLTIHIHDHLNPHTALSRDGESFAYSDACDDPPIPGYSLWSRRITTTRTRRSST